MASKYLECLNIVLTTEQKETLLVNAHQREISVSDYVRRIIFPKVEDPAPTSINLTGRRVKKSVSMDSATADALQSYCRANGWTLGEGVKRLLLKGVES